MPAAAPLLYDPTSVVAIFDGVAVSALLSEFGVAVVMVGAAATARKRGSARCCDLVGVSATCVLLACFGLTWGMLISRGLKEPTDTSWLSPYGAERGGYATGVSVLVGGVAAAVVSYIFAEQTLLACLTAAFLAFLGLDWGIVTVAGTTGTNAHEEWHDWQGGRDKWRAVSCRPESHSAAIFGADACAVGTVVGIVITLAALLWSWYSVRHVASVSATAVTMSIVLGTLGLFNTKFLRAALPEDMREDSTPEFVGIIFECAGIVGGIAHVIAGSAVTAISAIVGVIEEPGGLNEWNIVLCLLIACIGGSSISLFGFLLSQRIVETVKPAMATLATTMMCDRTARTVEDKSKLFELFVFFIGFDVALLVTSVAVFSNHTPSLPLTDARQGTDSLEGPCLEMAPTGSSSFSTVAHMSRLD